MIGTNISRMRKQKGLTLSELAEKSKISKSYLSNLERNLNDNPSIQVVEKLAEVLNVDLAALLQSDGDILVSDKEWLDFVNELKALGLERYSLEEYKIIFEFIRWKTDENK
ncbi:Transcriptional regulator, contains XRE-family HTH domain [Gracilibacillus ureilyticus]|uniref:Transcriptional regulator, contains XRE-family HTH domain n=1 Tax=Gracilibacillus ureilyticus TaxID=531814 RepID=A0A1H9PK48_9BACI|nr:helix-turn-helix transcriptional regulator [Gracilibacillus ureilyticus]SER48564.1 Transcriptional regulator, contains XRE-family HTH domain [Gracilibacillus ureilyticus]